MLSRAYEFAKRHRRKFLITSAVAGGLVLLGKYTESKFKEWQESETRQFLERTRKQHHFESTERTGNLTLQSLLPELRRSVAECLDSQKIVEEIRENAADKVDGWNRLKVVAFTRCVSYVFGGIYLSLLLRTQLHVIGGYLYRETVSRQQDGNGNDDDDDRRLSARVQERFLGLCQLFVRDGMNKMCSYVAGKVEKIVTGIALKKKMSLLDLEKVFREIVMEVLADKNESSPNVKPGDFMICLRDGFQFSDLDEKEVEAFKKLTADVKDILEHSDLRRIVAEGSNVGLNSVIDFLAENFSEKSDQRFQNLSDHQLPLAKLIPILNRFVQEDVNGHYQQSPFFQSLCSSPTMKQFSANVYEAFCHTDEQSNSRESSYDFQKFMQRFV